MKYSFSLFTLLLVFLLSGIVHAQDLSDDFEDDGELTGFVTNNENSLPNVVKVDGRYRAEVTNNDNNRTLHFNEFQGRLDAKLLTFPFEFIARNIGIGTIEDSQLAPQPTNDPYIFSGVQVHVQDFESINSSHVVVGHRGPTEFTIEGKNTLNAVSSVNDAGEGIVPDGRADIRIVGNEDRTLTVYWQLPEQEEDNWVLYNDTGDLPGDAPEYGDSVYVGLITYIFEFNGLPFVGTADAIEVTSQISVSNEGEQVPSGVQLYQNYPNPFNPSTEIQVSLKESGLTKLEVFSVDGRSVAILAERVLAAGKHTFQFDASSLSSGVYYYRLTASGITYTRQMTLIK